MLRRQKRRGIELPSSITSEHLMEITTSGLGYSWTVFVRDPVLVASGVCSNAGNPELAIIGERILLVEYEDEPQMRRLERMLDVIATENTRSRRGGV